MKAPIITVIVIALLTVFYEKVLRDTTCDHPTQYVRSTQ